MNSFEKMTKKSWLRHHRFEHETLLGKRWVWKEEQRTSNEAPKIDLGEERIKAHLGRSIEEKMVSVDDAFKAGGAQVEKLMKHWSYELTNTAISPRFLGSLITGGWIREANEKKLEDTITEAAKFSVEQEAKKTLDDDRSISSHTTNSLAILSEKARLAGVLRGNLDAEIARKEKLLEGVKGRLSWLRSLAESGLFLNSLQGEINTLKRISADAETIKEKAEKSNKARLEKNKVIEEHVSSIVQLASAHSPDEAGQIQRILGNMLLANSSPENFVGQLKQMGLSFTAGERSLIIAQYNILRNGHIKSGKMRLGVFEYGISKEDVRQYFIKNRVDIGELNEENETVENRVQKLAKAPVGQPILLSGKRYWLLKKEDKGYMLKNKDGYAYINVTNSKEPILTTSDAEGAIIAPTKLENAVADNDTEKPQTKNALMFKEGEKVGKKVQATEEPLSSTNPDKTDRKTPRSGFLRRIIPAFQPRRPRLKRNRRGKAVINNA